jgi:hypothetical protein
MTLGLCFWILMLVWLAFSLWSYWPGAPGGPPWVNNFFLFCMFLLIGWAIWGAPIRG